MSQDNQSSGQQHVDFLSKGSTPRMSSDADQIDWFKILLFLLITVLIPVLAVVLGWI